MTLTSTSGIATHIAESFVLPEGVSGNLIETVDCARIDVENYTGNDIGPSSIAERYQSAIKNFAIATSLDSAFSWAATWASSGTAQIGGGSSTSKDVKLGDLQVSDGVSSSEAGALSAISKMSQNAPSQFRELGMQALKSIGRKVQFARSLS